MSSEDLRRLEQELARLDAHIEALDPAARGERANGIRVALSAAGTWREDVDGPVLAKFARGVISLDQLAEHFHDRL
jgi:hypothetical protein